MLSTHSLNRENANTNHDDEQENKTQSQLLLPGKRIGGTTGRGGDLGLIKNSNGSRLSKKGLSFNGSKNTNTHENENENENGNDKWKNRLPQKQKEAQQQGQSSSTSLGNARNGEHKKGRRALGDISNKVNVNLSQSQKATVTMTPAMNNMPTNHIKAHKMGTGNNNNNVNLQHPRKLHQNYNRNHTSKANKIININSHSNFNTKKGEKSDINDKDNGRIHHHHHQYNKEKKVPSLSSNVSIPSPFPPPPALSTSTRPSSSSNTVKTVSSTSTISIQPPTNTKAEEDTSLEIESCYGRGYEEEETLLKDLRLEREKEQIENELSQLHKLDLEEASLTGRGKERGERLESIVEGSLESLDDEVGFLEEEMEMEMGQEEEKGKTARGIDVGDFSHVKVFGWGTEQDLELEGVINELGLEDEDFLL